MGQKGPSRPKRSEPSDDTHAHITQLSLQYASQVNSNTASRNYHHAASQVNSNSASRQHARRGRHVIHRFLLLTIRIRIISREVQRTPQHLLNSLPSTLKIFVGPMVRLAWLSIACSLWGAVANQWSDPCHGFRGTLLAWLSKTGHMH